MDDAKARSSDTTEFLTRERCHIRELVNDPETEDFSLAEVRVEPGVTTELHKLSVNEWYVIRRGSGKMEVGGGPSFVVVPGDFITVPAETSQRIRNTGTEDLIFECICLPRFTSAAYESLEDS